MNDAMMQGALYGAVIGGVVVVVMLLVAYSRRGSVAGTQLGGRRREVHTALDPDATFAAVQRVGAPFRLDDANADRRALVLSSSPTIASWGFFYPIVITAGSGGGSTLVIGVRSKVFQYGPIVTRWHGKCVDAIEAALAAPATQRAAR
jgi:hypothetical protein